jgi:hypothetical protein
MLKNPLKRTCLHCKESFETFDYRKKFCTRKCSVTYNNKNRVCTEETKQKLSNALKKYHESKIWTQDEKDKMSMAVGNATKNKYKKEPESILDLSLRTVCKIMKRLKVGCSYCGWNETVCDIHHINGRKCQDPDNHKNLTYLCPNCHRKCHKGLIKKDDLTSLEDYIGDRWKEFYYG